MTLKAEIEGVIQETSKTFNVGEWYWIYAAFFYNEGGLGASALYVNGGLYLTPYTATAQGTLKLSTSDIVRIGAGFAGKLRRLQVYSPTAYRLNWSTFYF